jgi:hypothetical protein
MDLYLRRVEHSQARNNYRVLLKIDEDEFEIGSIGITTFTSTDVTWTWGIDTVIPMRDHQSEGRGKDRRDCMAQFRAAWERHCLGAGWLEEFLAMKRQAQR